MTHLPVQGCSGGFPNKLSALLLSLSLSGLMYSPNVIQSKSFGCSLHKTNVRRDNVHCIVQLQKMLLKSLHGILKPFNCPVLLLPPLKTVGVVVLKSARPLDRQSPLEQGLWR